MLKVRLKKGGGRRYQIGEEKVRKEMEKEKIETAKNSKANPKRSIGSTNSKGSRKGDREEDPRIYQMNECEEEVLEKLGEYITVVANPVRIRMLAYCLKERSFTDIMLTLGLNPASLKHHHDQLHAGGFVEKTGKGKETRYKTTDLGKQMLSFAQEVLAVVRTS